MSELIFYTPEDGRRQIKLWAEQQTGWPPQLDWVELSADSIGKVSLAVQEMFV